jgi:tetratricopeptide (TPR) repeat protein
VEGFAHGSGTARQKEQATIALLYVNVALSYVNLHSFENGIRYARRAVELSRPIPGASDVRSQALSLIANALRYQGDLEAALTTIHEAREVAENATYASEASHFFGRYGLLLREGLILGEEDAANLNRPAEAIDLFQKALDLTEEIARKDPHDSASRGRVGTSARELGKILVDRDPPRALKVLDLGIRRLREAGNSLNTRRELAVLLAKSAYALRRLGRASEGQARIDTALEILKNTKDYPSERVRIGGPVYWVLRSLADYQAESGDPNQALTTYEQLLDEIMAANPDPLNDLRDAPKLSRIYESLLVLYRRTGNPAKAAEMKARRVELWQHWQQKIPNNTYVSRQLNAATGPFNERLFSMR